MRSCNFEKISLFSAMTGEIHLARVLQGGTRDGDSRGLPIFVAS
jgi:hypothetical protein